jgi:hypothetical protein
MASTARSMFLTLGTSDKNNLRNYFLKYLVNKKMEGEVPILNKYEKYTKPKLADPEFKAKRLDQVNTINKARYKQDDEFRQKTIDYSKKYYLENKEKILQRCKERYQKRKLLQIK